MSENLKRILCYDRVHMNPKLQRKIIHVDMDAFYASVEQRDNPKLIGKPIAVGYASKRGVIAAASYEARTFGVHSAMPLITAMKLCPQLIVLPPRFDVYRSVSQEIHTIFADFTDIIEPLALDEAYLDVTKNKQEIETAWKTAKIIRSRIFEKTGLTASAGISYNKFLAKLASDMKKPNGQYAITPDMGEEFIAQLPIAKFYGIGPVTAKKMIGLGIHTGKELRLHSLDDLQKHFGKVGIWYYDLARGIDDREVNPNRERKSVGSETTFEQDSSDRNTIESEIIKMAELVWKWCEESKKRGRTVTIKITWSDFSKSTRSKTLENKVTTFDQLQKTSLELLQSLFPLKNKIRLVGVTISHFV